jgi:hypothetical protein
MINEPTKYFGCMIPNPDGSGSHVEALEPMVAARHYDEAKAHGLRLFQLGKDAGRQEALDQFAAAFDIDKRIADAINKHEEQQHE